MVIMPDNNTNCYESVSAVYIRDHHIIYAILFTRLLFHKVVVKSIFTKLTRLLLEVPTTYGIKTSGNSC